MMLSDDYIELKPVGLTRGTSLKGAFILLLREKLGARFIPVLVSEREFEMLRRILLDGKQLPEDLATTILHAFDIKIDYINIGFSREDGYKATLVLLQEGELRLVNTNLGYGIISAMRHRAPLRMARQLFEQQTGQHREDGQVSLPLSAMSNELLEEALTTAVKEENFELASQLRDEIKARNEHDKE